MHRCRSPFIVAFYGAYARRGCLWLATEWMDCGALDVVLRRTGPLPEPILTTVAASVCLAERPAAWAVFSPAFRGCVGRQVLLGLNYLFSELRVLHRGRPGLQTRTRPAQPCFLPPSPRGG